MHVRRAVPSALAALPACRLVGVLEQLITQLAALEGMVDEAISIMAEAAAPLDGALAESSASSLGNGSGPGEGAAADGGDGMANGELLPAFRLVYGQVAAACAAYSQLLASGQVCCWAAGLLGQAAQGRLLYGVHPAAAPHVPR